MTIFIILMIIVYMVNCQEKTAEDIQKIRQEYLKKHQDSMRIYDTLYQIRQKRHQQWLQMMKQMEDIKNKKED